MSSQPTRRDFLAQLGVSTAAGAAIGASAAGLLGSGTAQAQEKPKGNIPSTPFKIGHMTFFTGAGAVLGEPMYKGNLLAADEINAHGGLLGKRKIEVLKADEAAGTDPGAGGRRASFRRECRDARRRAVACPSLKTSNSSASAARR